MTQLVVKPTARHISIGGTAYRIAATAAAPPPPETPPVSILGTAVPVGHNPDWYSGSPTTTVTDANFRASTVVLFNSTDVRLVFANAAGQETSLPPGNLTITAAIEVAGVMTACTFSGASSVTLAPGEMAVGIAAVSVTAGTRIYPRCHATVASGGWIPRGRTRYNAYSEGGDTNATDESLSGTITGPSVQLFSPLVVAGTPSGTHPIIGMVGDSIVWGQGDAPADALYPAGQGFVARALNNQFAAVKTAAQGERAANFASAAQRPVRGRLLVDCDYAVCNYGINDIRAAASLLSVQSSLLLVWRFLNDMGVKTYQTTITPESTSTDAWVTTTNQAIKSTAQNTVRTSLNDWLRAGAPINSFSLAPALVGAAGTILAGAAGHPLTGYFETADLVESARNSGIWKANVTGDGVHPNAAGHIALAAAVNTALFV